MIDAQHAAAYLLDRIHRHWPEAVGETTASSPGGVAVCIRVADGLWLELRSPEQAHLPWSVTPVIARETGFAAIGRPGTYGIGVTVSDNLDTVADRFYEEVRFWWAEYQALATRDEARLP
jgi:hypothetical protein